MRTKQIIAKRILALFGWKVTGEIPQTTKGLFVVVPHTHWEDFPLGLMVRQYLGLEVKFIAKKSLFTGVKGFVFRWLGGYPVDRKRSIGFVKSVVDIFDSHERFFVAIAPEGTRKKVDHLKTGFYYIALQANIPLFLTSFDYEKKRIHISEPVWPEASNPNQLKEIEDYFRGVPGRIIEHSF